MSRPTLSILALSALTIVVATACGAGTTFVRMPHPLQVGSVQSNRIPVEALRDQRARGLPESSLVDEAELLSLNPEQICLRVNLWATQDNPERSNMQAYRIALLNDEEGVELSGPSVTPEQGTVDAFHGFRTETQYRGGANVSRHRTPVTWEITNQPYVLCFSNGGFIRPTTEKLVLELEDAGARNRINFEWAFDSSVAGPVAED